jgi:long-chain acyl-CoA synthetase
VDAVVKTGSCRIGAWNQEPAFLLFATKPYAERLAVEMNGIYNGCAISFSESLASFAKDLAATQPNCFLAVPRIWAKFREGILKKMPQDKLDRLLRMPVIGAIVKRSIKKKLGLAQRFCYPLRSCTHRGRLVELV